MTGLDQVGIGVFGVIAIILSQDPRERVRRWACFFGLAAQPFWFWTTYIHEQWAIFGLSFFYTAAWIRGLRTYWMLRRPAERQDLKEVDDFYDGLREVAGAAAGERPRKTSPRREQPSLLQRIWERIRNDHDGGF